MLTPGSPNCSPRCWDNLEMGRPLPLHPLRLHASARTARRTLTWVLGKADVRSVSCVSSIGRRLGTLSTKAAWSGVAAHAVMRKPASQRRWMPSLAYWKSSSTHCTSQRGQASRTAIAVAEGKDAGQASRHDLHDCLIMPDFKTGTRSIPGWEPFTQSADPLMLLLLQQRAHVWGAAGRCHAA